MIIWISYIVVLVQLDFLLENKDLFIIIDQKWQISPLLIAWVWVTWTPKQIAKVNNLVNLVN